MHAFLILVILFQTMNQARYLMAMYQGYHGKTIEERRSPLLRKISLFAQYCQERLPGQHNARFLSDLDLSNDPGMFIHRALAYYLYPIDIRDIRKGDKDSLIIHKANAVQHIPEGYTLVGQWNEYAAVAIKSQESSATASQHPGKPKFLGKDHTIYFPIRQESRSCNFWENKTHVCLFAAIRAAGCLFVLRGLLPFQGREKPLAAQGYADRGGKDGDDPRRAGGDDMSHRDNGRRLYPGITCLPPLVRRVLQWTIPMRIFQS